MSGLQFELIKKGVVSNWRSKSRILHWKYVLKSSAQKITSWRFSERQVIKGMKTKDTEFQPDT